MDLCWKAQKKARERQIGHHIAIPIQGKSIDGQLDEHNVRTYDMNIR